MKLESYHHFPIVGNPEAVLDKTATHSCRYRAQATRFNPRMCERRKRTQDKSLVRDGYYPFWQCETCEGPIQIKNIQEHQDMMSATYHCNKCNEERPINDFYPSNKKTCKDCLKKKAPAPVPVAEEPLVEAPKPEAEAKPEPEVPVSEPEPEKEIRSCRECGADFETYYHGMHKVHLCRECLGARLKKAQQDSAKLRSETPKQVTLTLTFEDGDRAMLEALTAYGKKNRRNPDQQLLVMLEEWMEKEVA